MYHPMFLYELGKSVHEERLREAEQARLSSVAKSGSANKFKKRGWHVKAWLRQYILPISTILSRSRRHKMSTNGILTQKEKELVAIGASIAAGCQPCIAHHFRAVRQAGATEAEIRQAVDAALCVRNSATKIMTGLAEKHLGNEHAVEEPCCSSKPLISELVSIGAALAVNCATNLEIHLQAARTVGATERQIQTALGVARAIKKVAEQKAEAITTPVARQKVEVAAATVAELAGLVKAESDGGCDDGCGCSETAGSQSVINSAQSFIRLHPSARKQRHFVHHE